MLRPGLTGAGENVAVRRHMGSAAGRRPIPDSDRRSGGGGCCQLTCGRPSSPALLTAPHCSTLLTLQAVASQSEGYESLFRPSLVLSFPRFLNVPGLLPLLCRLIVTASASSVPGESRKSRCERSACEAGHKSRSKSRSQRPPSSSSAPHSLLSSPASKSCLVSERSPPPLSFWPSRPSSKRRP